MIGDCTLNKKYSHDDGDDDDDDDDDDDVSHRWLQLKNQSVPLSCESEQQLKGVARRFCDPGEEQVEVLLVLLIQSTDQTRRVVSLVLDPPTEWDGVLRLESRLRQLSRVIMREFHGSVQTCGCTSSHPHDGRPVERTALVGEAWPGRKQATWVIKTSAAFARQMSSCQVQSAGKTKYIRF